jgi:hypothetical protein
LARPLSITIVGPSDRIFGGLGGQVTQCLENRISAIVRRPILVDEQAPCRIPTHGGQGSVSGVSGT